VQGAVRRAGLYQIEGQPSLLKLITIAGGLTENYGSTAFIIREISAIGDQGVRNDAGSQDSSKPIDSNGSH
jgi:protein involved in polysaccharide export with SLBB domain